MIFQAKHAGKGTGDIRHPAYQPTLLAQALRSCQPFLRVAGIAQLVEHLICNQAVVGSNPTAGSINFSYGMEHSLIVTLFPSEVVL